MAPWEVVCMDGILRWTVAIVAAAMLFTSSMAVAGIEAANEPPGPAWFDIADPHPGDEALYKTALVVVRDGEGEYVDMEASFAFERLPPGLMLDDGALVPVDRIVSEWRTAEFTFDVSTVLGFPMTGPMVTMPGMPGMSAPDCMGGMGGMGTYGDPTAYDEQWEQEFEQCMESWAEDFESSMEAWAEDLEARMEEFEAEFERWAEDFEYYMSEWEASLLRDVHTVRAQGWHVTHTGTVDAVTVRPTDPDLIDPRPGAPLQGVLDDLPLSFARMLQEDTVTVLHEAPAPCGWKNALQDGHDLHRPMRVHGQCPSDMFLGFADVAPLPGPIDVRVVGEDRVNGNDTVVFAIPGQEDDLRLWFTESVPYPVRILSRTDAVPDPVAQQIPGYEEPAFYVLHELVRFEAGEAAKEPAPKSKGDLSGMAGFWGADARGSGHAWTVRDALDDAGSHADCGAFRAWMQQHATANVVASAQTDSWWLLLEHEGQRMSLDIDPDGTCSGVTTSVGSALGPGRMPTVVNGGRLLEQWSGDEVTHYGHDGIDRRILTVRGDASMLSVDSQGRLHGWSSDESPEPRFSDPAWDPDADGDWNLRAQSSGAWSMPRPATAATIAAGSAAAGALILLWPAIKGALTGIGLFSRIRKEDLLEHPVRADVFDAIQTDPGIHFQELVRRIGKGRGTMEHHVRKLVSAGLLVEKAERGFTCYFPKGEVDRRLMDVAPLFKADGARRVVQAVQAQPGAATMELAATLGMATSTVNYHVKRLVDAGLLDPQREGRYVRLHLTDLGGEALGRFGRT